MLITEIGKGVIVVDDSNYQDWCSKKIHIIKLFFKEPTKYKIQTVFENYKKTNRFIIEDNIRFYNYILKDVNKKYYIENTTTDRILSFFKRNNKVVLNIHKLNPMEQDILYDNVFLSDLLSNLEVIIIDENFYEDNKKILDRWTGNVILSSDGSI